jgi:hypothetical protein
LNDVSLEPFSGAGVEHMDLLQGKKVRLLHQRCIDGNAALIVEVRVGDGG